MRIEIKVDKKSEDIKIIIVTQKITDEVNNIIKRLSEDTPRILIGFREDTATILNEADLYNIYSLKGRIAAVTDNGKYSLRLRLYELEERLDKSSFVRISNSEIVNLKKIKSFDLSFAGTICINFTNNTLSYVSRRYVAKIKQVLGI